MLGTATGPWGGNRQSRSQPGALAGQSGTSTRFCAASARVWTGKGTQRRNRLPRLRLCRLKVLPDKLVGQVLQNDLAAIHLAGTLAEINFGILRVQVVPAILVLHSPDCGNGCRIPPGRRRPTAPGPCLGSNPAGWRHHAAGAACRQYPPTGMASPQASPGLGRIWDARWEFWTFLPAALRFPPRRTQPAAPAPQHPPFLAPGVCPWPAPTSQPLCSPPSV